jgi:2-dehydro-3-deoxygluconokinase
MPVLDLRPREECTFDHVSLGEVMLRLDPGDMRVKTAREFRAWEGGGEYNVARGLRRCFGLRTAIVTALADNAVGRLVEDLMLQGGVDVSQVRWVPYDGLGRIVRNGLNLPNEVSVSAALRVSPIAGIRRPASSSRATSTGSISSVLSARAGSTPGASTRGCPSRLPRSSRRP